MDSDDVVGQFFVELKSYAPVVLPTLVVYAIESVASLKLWHAVQQLPHLEKDKPADDVESHVNAEHLLEVRAARDAVKREAWRTRIQQFVICLLLLAIFVFEEYVQLKGMLNRSKEGEEFEGFSGASDDAEFEADNGYMWYYDSTFGQIDWAKSYYLVTLFLPAVLLLTRTIYLLFGLKDRAVLRDTRGMPFMVAVPGSRFVPRRPALMGMTVVLASVSLAAGALWYHSNICSAILFASIVHCVISYGGSGKIVAFKHSVIASFIMLTAISFMAWSVLETGDTFPFRLFRLSPLAGDMNWSGLILSALVSAGPFQFMALCYRMDHAFARSDELLVGGPDVKVPVRGADAVEIYGTRISYFSRFSSCCSTSTSSSRCAMRPRWAKPYFHSAVWSWLTVYAIIAALTVMGYIESEAELAGVYALYLSPPVTCLGVMTCALARGEVKRLWGYKEDWACERGERNDEQAIVSEVEVKGLDEKGAIEL